MFLYHHLSYPLGFNIVGKSRKYKKQIKLHMCIQAYLVELIYLHIVAELAQDSSLDKILE
jgi:hypothetical protein